MNAFDPASSSLSGVCVVEASAGTGKTWSLGVLYLRCLLELERTPAQIVVLTFSRAAAQDLRDRLTEMLHSALAFRPTESKSNDAFQRFLRAQHSRLGELFFQRLRSAEATFDLAPISTIHAFCLRLLNEHRSRVGLPPGAIELVEASPAAEVIDRHERNRRLRREPETHGFASRSALKNRLETWLKSQKIRIYPKPSDAPTALAQFNAQWAQADPESAEKEFTWLIELERRNIFLKDKFDPKRLSQLWAALAAAPDALSAQQVADLACLRIDYLDQAQKKNLRITDLALRLPTLTALEPAFKALRLYYAALRSRALAELRVATQTFSNERALREGTLDFDAAVSALARALDADPEFARTLASAYPVALIDEFQDTDATQYAIFRAIYRGRPGTLLYLIGDPKQAIYRFRGGDVFAYLKARDDAASVSVMGTNFRSHAQLVAAVNHLYTHAACANPLGYPNLIKFRPVSAHISVPVDDFHGIEWVADDGTPIERALVASVKALLADPGIRPDDIAILTKANDQVGKIAAALRQAGLPVRAIASIGIFEQAPFAFLYELLEAFAGDRQAWAKFLLLGPLGWTDPQLAMTDAEPDFLWLKSTFAAHGSVAALVQCAQRFTQRLHVQRGTGLRALSAIRQTAEWLATLDVQGHDVSAQIAAMRLARGVHVRERPTDHRAVIRVLTVHQAKGLEFGIVLLPYLFRSNQYSGSRDALYHDPKEDLALSLDLGSEQLDEHLELEMTEARGDDFRLLYVALTRAVRRTLIFRNLNMRSSGSALAELLMESPGSRKEFEAALPAVLAQLVDCANGSMRLRQVPADQLQEITDSKPQNPALENRPYQPRAPWRWSSFSALRRSTRPQWFGGPLVGEDQPVLAPGPRGAHYGECVHALLETLDFAHVQASERLRLDIALALQNFGLSDDPLSIALTERLLLNAAHTPLPPLNCALAHLSPHDLLRESRFVSAQAQSCEVLGLQVPRGAMSGFIDLALRVAQRYFVLDFKTNDLGPDPAEYSPSALREDVRENGYDAQAQIYAQALIRKLRLSNPDFVLERDFGGALVVYLRGLDPALPGNGVVHLSASEFSHVQ